MKGGIDAWNGLVAEGIPEAGMLYFSSAHSPAEYLALAWLLEEGTRKFYNEVATMLDPSDQEAAALFRDLVVSEEHHKALLLTLYREATGRKVDASENLAESALPELPAENLIEGGMSLEEALDWVRQKPVEYTLEFSMTLEASAYDRYLYMQGELGDDASRRILEILIDQERKHLDRLTGLFDRILQP